MDFEAIILRKSNTETKHLWFNPNSFNKNGTTILRREGGEDLMGNSKP